MAPSFPLYRMLVNGASLYRIEAEDRFTELQRIGERWLVHEVVADRYPERLRVAELIAAQEQGIAPCSPERFEAAWALRRS